MSRVEWPPSAGKVRNVLRRAACLQIAILIRKADDRIGVAYVDPLRIGSGRIEVYAERPIQTAGEDRHLFGPCQWS